MPSLEIDEYAAFDAFAADWQASADDAAEQYWALLGALDADELLVVLPEWLAAEKVGYVEGAAPTAFVGRIDRETDAAIRLADATAAKPLGRLARRIESLETSIARLEDDDTDPERLTWLRDRLREKRAAFADRTDGPTLADAWLPKSQLEFVGRRTTRQ